MNAILLERSDFESFEAPGPPDPSAGPAACAAAAEVRRGVARLRADGPQGGRRLRHLRKVLRAKPGDVVRVGLVDDLLGRARIAALDAEQARLEVVLDTPPPPPLDVTLVLAVPRPPVLARTLAAATSFGVKRIVVLHARRVERTYWRAAAMQPAALRRALLHGLEQARDTRLPELLLRPRFRPFAEDELPGWLRESSGVLAHEGDAPPCPARLALPCVAAIGPEGGFVDFELEMLRAAGLQPASLGPRALRVESAVAALLSRAL